MASALAPRPSAIAVPSRQELEQLGPGDRWTLEERLDQCQDVLRDFNDEELRHWIEVEGISQAEAGKRVGRSQQRIAQRCARAGIHPKTSHGGRPKGVTSPSNSDGEEVIDAVLAEETPGERPAEHFGTARAGEGGRDISVHFSSATDEWATPQDLFDELDSEFSFELDVCALDSSAKCPTYFTPESDGLASSGGQGCEHCSAANQDCPPGCDHVEYAPKHQGAAA